MQNKTILAGISALTLSAIVLPSVYAFGGFAGPGNQNFDPAKTTAIETAIENQDFAAFQTATGNTRMTEDQFTKMATNRATMEADRTAIETAITNGDYAAWVKLITAKNSDAPILEVITASNFSKLQELQNLHEQAQAIQEELGIESPGFGGMGMGGDMKGGEHGRGGRGGMFGSHDNDTDEE
ncbi:MAG: hypothetical protein WCV72_04820 [Patescibacteria group bacterium]|jgi:hypothetical protein